MVTINSVMKPPNKKEPKKTKRNIHTGKLTTAMAFAATVIVPWMHAQIRKQNIFRHVHRWGIMVTTASPQRKTDTSVSACTSGSARFQGERGIRISPCMHTFVLVLKGEWHEAAHLLGYGSHCGIRVPRFEEI
jgi:hypothetical protein